MANVVGSLLINISAGIAGLSRDLDKATSEIQKSMGKVGDLVNVASRSLVGFGTALAGVGISMGVSAIGDLVRATLDNVDALDEQAQRLGLNIEQLQAYTQAGEQAGLSSEQMEKALKTLNDNIGKAVAGNKEAQKAFVATGVSFQTVNGAARETDEVFRDVLDSMAQVDNVAVKTERANNLLGRTGYVVAAAFNTGTIALDQYMAKARELGLILDQEQAQKALKAQEAFEKLSFILRAEFMQIVAELSPALQRLAEWFTQLALDTGAWLQQLGLIPATLKGVETQISNLERAASLYERTIGRVTGLFTKRDAILRSYDAEIEAEKERYALLKQNQALEKSREAAKPKEKPAPPAVTDAAAAEKSAKAIAKAELDAKLRALDLEAAYRQKAQAELQLGDRQALEQQLEANDQRVAATVAYYDKLDQLAKTAADKREVALEREAALIREKIGRVQIETELARMESAEARAFGEAIARAVGEGYAHAIPSALADPVADVMAELDTQLRGAEIAGATLGEPLTALETQINATRAAILKLATDDDRYAETVEYLKDRLAELIEQQKEQQYAAEISRSVGEAFAAQAAQVDVATEAAVAWQQSLEEARATIAATGGTLADELNAEIKVTTAYIQSLATADGRFNEEIARGNQYLAELQARLSQITLAERFTEIERAAAALGSGFQRLPAQIREVTSEIQRLLKLPPSPETEAQISSLSEQLRQLETQAELVQSVRDVFQGISRAITTSITGIIQGTQSVSDAFAKMSESIVLSITERIINRGLKALEDAIVEFMTSKMVRDFLVKILGSFAGGAGIGAGELASLDIQATQNINLGAAGLAQGGIVQSPTFAVVGERGPEAVIPLDRMQTAAPAGTVVNIIDQRQSGSIQQRQGTGADGQQQIEILILDTVRSGMNSGTFDRALGANFGIGRRGVSR